MQATASPQSAGGQASRAAGPPRVLVVEDDEDQRALVAEILRAVDLDVVTARDADEAFAAVDRALLAKTPRYFDLVVTDLFLPTLSGLDLLWTLRLTDYPVPAVLVSGLVNAGTLARANGLGVVAVLSKPFSVDELIAIARQATASPWWLERCRRL